MRHRLWVIATVLVAVWIGGTSGCKHQVPGPATETPSLTGRSVVVWISVDGLRPDYVERAPAPFLQRLMREGSFSRRVTTVVPSLTFPSHDSEATGVMVDHHGIPANAFYDSADQKLYSYAADASLLGAEPIWLTAPRQHRRTLVYDWPMSQKQNGPIKSDYFLGGFDKDFTDDQRLDRLIQTWQADIGDKPLQLLMGYVSELDVVGHKRGPDSSEVLEAMRRVDARLEKFFTQAQKLFKQKMNGDGRLYFLITTDHGMAPVHTLVHLEHLLSSPMPRGVRVVRSGPVGLIYLDQFEKGAAAQLKPALVRDLSRHPFLHVYAREQVPREWGFSHPTRVGDVVAICKPGYTFSERLPAGTFPVAQGPGPYGMHGYIPAECPEMRGLCILWGDDRARTGAGAAEGTGRDLGDVSALQFHPTVARILGIEPARDARARPLPLP